MKKEVINEEYMKRFDELSNYNINESHWKEYDIKEDVTDKYVGTDLYESAKKRMNMLMEFTSLNRSLEADDKENAPENGGDEGGGMPPMGGDTNGGQDAGGGMPPMGGDPNGGQDAGGGMPPMGGDPNGGQDAGGGMPPMGGDTNGGQNGPEGFNPQVDGGMDAGMDPNLGMDGGMGDDPNQMQQGDEVVDITELLDNQEEEEHKIEKLGDKFDKVFQAIGKFEELLKSNDEKIEGLKSEFEKRNPTQIEKLSMQTDKSYPFNVKPEDYWANKEATSNYSTENDNNGKEQGQYAITANDLKGAVDWKSISDSLDDDDFIYNQTLDGVLKL